jgi:hypothetical protein
MRENEKITNKRAKFTNVGKETKFITKLFKYSSLKISFKPDNIIG